MLNLLFFFMIVAAAAASGAIFKPGSWYETLRKPAWTPPNWVFPVVWTILYIMIAIAGWLVWQQAGWNMALAFWSAQIVVNAAWSWLFFHLRRMDLALFDIGILWVSVAGFILFAAPISLTAALLFVPYLVWVTTAGLLNFTVYRLNPAS